MQVTQITSELSVGAISGFKIGLIGAGPAKNNRRVSLYTTEATVNALVYLPAKSLFLGGNSRKRG